MNDENNISKQQMLAFISETKIKFLEAYGIDINNVSESQMAWLEKHCPEDVDLLERWNIVSEAYRNTQ